MDPKQSKDTEVKDEPMEVVEEEEESMGLQAIAHEIQTLKQQLERKNKSELEMMQKMEEHHKMTRKAMEVVRNCER